MPYKVIDEVVHIKFTPNLPGIRDGKRRKILFQAYFKPRPISSLINQFWDGAVVRIKR